MLLTGSRGLLDRGAQRIELGNEHIMAGKGVSLGGQGIQNLGHIDHLLALDQAKTAAIESAQFHG